MIDGSRYTCEQVFRRLNDYVDRELSAEEIARVEEHLDDCAECAHEYAFEMTFLREIKSSLRRITMPDTLRAKVRRLLDSLESGEEPS
ncbi:MAG TPA: zf-HC2 domain-containing protein [Gemmatimonadota bacterium]|nr:zf-HC2 domain-containing protein [Gemmatimonadota bacterium]